MAMTPNDFMEGFVDANFHDFRNDPGNVARAFNAAVAASHFLDHFYNYNAKKNPQLVAKFGSLTGLYDHVNKATNGAMRDVRSIANAYKHLYTFDDARRAAHSTVSSAGAIESLRLEWDDALESLDSDYPDDLLDDSVERRGPAVFVTRKDGSRSEVMPIIEAVIDYYSSALWMRNGDT